MNIQPFLRQEYFPVFLVLQVVIPCKGGKYVHAGKKNEKKKISNE